MKKKMKIKNNSQSIVVAVYTLKVTCQKTKQSESYCMNILIKKSIRRKSLRKKT